MRSTVVAVVLLVLAGSVAAEQDTSLAHAHARSSTTLYLSTTWSPSPTVPIRAGGDGALRLHVHWVALEARFGFGLAASVLGLGAHSTAHGGFSIGAALPLGRRVVVAPMLAVDAFLGMEHYGDSVWVHYTTVALPLSIVLARGAVVEVLVQAGFARYYGTTDPAIIVGPRLGLVL